MCVISQGKRNSIVIDIQHICNIGRECSVYTEGFLLVRSRATEKVSREAEKDHHRMDNSFEAQFHTLILWLTFTSVAMLQNTTKMVAQGANILTKEALRCLKCEATLDAVFSRSPL